MSAASSLELQTRAYDALNAFFAQHEDAVVEIEIVPSSLIPDDALILQDGTHLGVPKKTLALAFAHARRQFFAHQPDGSLSTSALDATRAILLFDPEHLTAANFRKRHLLALASSASSPTIYPSALSREQAFLSSILTSPLHRQAKSPTLWHHRAWLLPHLPAPDAGFVRAELDVVGRAGERHPKNYYAWQYARRMVEYCRAGGIDEELDAECVAWVQRWCFRHPSDVSGWAFLGWLIRALGAGDGVVEKVVEYATGLRLANEALWGFVRTGVGSGLEDEGRRDALIEKMKQECKEKPGTELTERVARTVRWIEKHGTSDSLIQG